MSKQKYPQNTATSTGAKRPVKENGYSSATLHAKHDKKRAEAEARQRECASRTTKERMDLCCRRPGNSSREFKRLQVRAEKERAAAKA